MEAWPGCTSARGPRQMSAGRTFYLVNSVNLWFVGLRAREASGHQGAALK